MEINPYLPSPCGLYSECRKIGEVPSCSCLPNYIGTPPSCRPECTINSDCSSNLACINQKCRASFQGSCGTEAICNVIMHTPTCSCPAGYTGDPFTFCSPKIQEIEPLIHDPCNPSPCGPNSICNGGV